MAPRNLLFFTFVFICSTAQATIDKDTLNGCELYGANMGLMWQAIHEKHMTLEQLNDGVELSLGKAKYYRMLSEQQAVLDNPRYAGAVAMNVAVIETAECLNRRS